MCPLHQPLIHHSPTIVYRVSVISKSYTRCSNENTRPFSHAATLFFKFSLLGMMMVRHQSLPCHHQPFHMEGPAHIKNYLTPFRQSTPLHMYSNEHSAVQPASTEKYTYYYYWERMRARETLDPRIYYHMFPETKISHKFFIRKKHI